MKFPFYQVDAFATAPFQGNPAAVCVLQNWLDDATLRAIARENNLAETAFIIRHADSFAIRWFTSLGEINLCGHATLASAHVVFDHLGYNQPQLRFTTQSVGDLSVSRDGTHYVLDFPAWMPELLPTFHPLAPPGLGGVIPLESHLGRDYLFVFPDATTVKNIQPDFKALQQLGKLICLTAPGDATCDFVSRFFCPGDAVEEDPVTGSAHCMLTPYWAQRLQKNHLIGHQFSARGTAEIHCTLNGDRVNIAGAAVTVIAGMMTL